MSYQVEETQLGNNNYIPMEKMFLHADDIEENRRSAETYLNKALGMGVILILIFFLNFEVYIPLSSGDVLAEILDDCSKSTPEDPISFVANSLER